MTKEGTGGRSHALANGQIDERLRRYGHLLEQQGADVFRVRAYQTAADLIDARTTRSTTC